jgi:hypothetical protein
MRTASIGWAVGGLALAACSVGTGDDTGTVTLAAISVECERVPEVIAALLEDPDGAPRCSVDGPPCPCGASCDVSAGRCTAQCLSTDDDQYGCAAGETCGPDGLCAPAGGPQARTVPGALPLVDAPGPVHIAVDGDDAASWPPVSSMGPDKRATRRRSWAIVGSSAT